jgi:sulfonate transport system substrate-binding protein
MTTAAATLALSMLVAACGSSSSTTGSATTSAAAVTTSAAAGTTTTAAVATTATSVVTVSAKNSSLPTLVVGDQAGTGAEADLEAAGLLHKLPFNVQFADFTAGPPILQAASSGHVDVGGVGNAPPVFIAAAGGKVKVVGAQKTAIASAALLVPKGSSVHSVAQLKGKTIAVGEGTSGDAHLLLALKQAGLTRSDVTVDNLTPAAALVAFTTGKVAAWDVWSPYIEEAEIKYGARELDNGSVLHGDYSYIVASDAALQNPTKAKEIAEYVHELDLAYEWINSNIPAYAKVWADAVALPDNIMVTAAKDHEEWPVPINASVEASEQSLVNAFASAGEIPKQFSFKPYITTSLNSSVPATS